VPEVVAFVLGVVAFSHSQCRWEHPQLKVEEPIMKNRFPRPVFLLGVVSLLLLSWPAASGAQMGTDFSYHGTLADTGGPTNGVRDIQVTLFDAATGGAVVGGPLDFDDVVVTEGRFTLELDFGAVFDGSPVWLEFALRNGASVGDHVIMAPRQKLHAVPYAAHTAHAETALMADVADGADEADTLNGEDGAFYLDWDNLTGIPTGVEDGDDDALASLSCDPDEIPVWGAAGWECGPQAGPVPSSVSVVGPVGDPSANGAALMAAMDAIPTPASAEEAHLLLIEPGDYDLGDGMLVGKPWVTIAGAGQNITTISSSICVSGTSWDTGTVLLASNEEIRDLSVVNDCSEDSDTAYGITVPSDRTASRVTRVTIRAQAGPTSSRAIAFNSAGSQLVLTSVSAYASAGTFINSAILDASGDRSEITDCVGFASGGTTAYGLQVYHLATPPERHATVTRGSFHASAATTTYGIYIGNISVDLVRTEAVGERAVWVSNITLDNTVRISQLVTEGGVEMISSSGSLSASIDRSRIVAVGPTVTSATGAIVRVAASQLWGGSATGTGTLSCAGVWGRELDLLHEHLSLNHDDVGGKDDEPSERHAGSLRGHDAAHRDRPSRRGRSTRERLEGSGRDDRDGREDPPELRPLLVVGGWGGRIVVRRVLHPDRGGWPAWRCNVELPGRCPHRGRLGCPGDRRRAHFQRRLRGW
jgi:hypothetical protein